MIRHYLAITLRNIAKKRTVSFINILGLTTGIASSMLIFLWVNDEIHFDQFHENYEDIYRVYSKEHWSEGTYSQLAVQAPLGPALQAKYPEIKNSSRFFILSKTLLKCEQKGFWEDGIAFADSSFFEIFSFPFVKGNSVTALEDMNSIVLTQEMADKYFPETDPVGKVITIQKYSLTITGVIKDIPEKSSFQYDFIIPFNFLQRLWDMPDMNHNWNSSTFYTYLLLHKNIDVEHLRKELIPFYKEYCEWDDYELHIQPFKDVYLNPVEAGEYNLNGNITTVYLFSFVAVLILILISINFINLYTAASISRAKEIGVRKCVGFKKTSLVFQFFQETFVFILLGFIFALGIVILVMPSFNVFTNKEIIIDPGNYWIIIGFVLILLLTSIFAGIYPALYLSAFKPLQVLKGNLFLIEGKLPIRKTLIVFQFFISIFLMISTVVAYKQMNFLKNKDLGFSMDHVINITLDDDTNYQLLKNELLENPIIESVSATNYFSTEGVSNTDELSFEGQQEEANFNLTIQQIDFDYFETLGIKMIEGRGFKPDMKTDVTSAYVMNEKAVEMMGIDKPIGKTFSLWGKRGTIIGIANNANFLTLKLELDPRLYMIKWEDEKYENVLVKFHHDPSDTNPTTPEVIGFIKDTWKNVFQDTPFDYQFVDQIYDRIYRTEERNNKIFGFFTILAIAISCLGLLGLTLLSAQQKTKEISIHKVHGASIANIIGMLNTDFLKLIAAAFVISGPVAFYTSQKFLQSFAYRTNISWWIFLLVGIVVMFIAILTVSYQSWRIAKTNPVEGLKYE